MEDYRKIAIELGKTLISKAPETRKDVERMLPELKELDGESIRESLLEYLHTLPNHYAHSGVCAPEWIAWLEKQGKKPTDKVEPKFHEGDIIIHKELGGDYIHNPHKIIQVDILDKKYRLEGGLVAHFGEQEDYELVEQKPAWSEEDDKIALSIEQIFNCASLLNIVPDKIEKVKSWLKDIKDRVQPQLRWKPSELQIEALESATENCAYSEHQDCLRELIGQLKKLKKG